jgi:hypothetical protein
MTLQSIMFRGNARLQRCLVSDAAHVKNGDKGDHVRLIQGALLTLDNAEISSVEQAQHLYGPSTAKAVLNYKNNDEKRKKIINFRYQTQADAIVGKMTIRSLDTEMLAHERGRFRLLLAAGVTLPVAKIVILSESEIHAQRWANQVAVANGASVVLIDAPGKSTPEANVVVIKQAIATANGGLLIFNVGHGFCLKENRGTNTEEGAFDIAPDAVMRIEGKNFDNDPKQFVNVFYDDKPPSRSGGGLKPLSDKDLDERDGKNVEKRRKFSMYEDLSKAFIAGKLGGIVLATCNVGRATGLLKKVATQWRTPIIAYRDTWMFFETPSRRTRAIMAGDQRRANTPTPGTNTPFGEVMFPLSLTDMVLITQ